MVEEFAQNLNYGPEPDTISYLIKNGATVKEVQVEIGRTSGGPERPDLLAQRAVYGQNVHLDSVHPAVPQARHRDALPRKEPVKCSIKR